MEHEGPLPCPQQPATCPNSGPDQPSTILAADFFRIHLHLALRNGLLPSGLTTRPLYTPLHSAIRATNPTYLILMDLIIRVLICGEYKS